MKKSGLITQQAQDIVPTDVERIIFIKKKSKLI